MIFRFNGATYLQQHRRCGRQNCRTCRDGEGHGPYWYERKDGRLRYFGHRLPAEVEQARQVYDRTRTLLHQLEQKVNSLRRLTTGERLDGHDLDILESLGITLGIEAPAPSTVSSVLRRIEGTHTAADERVIADDPNARFALGGLVEGLPTLPPTWGSCVPATTAPAQDEDSL